MDGNRRWAERCGLPVSFGHRKGAQAAKQVVLDCKELGVEFLTLYTFSMENWNRPEAEVINLMALLREYLKTDVKELLKHDVRLMFIGDTSRLDIDIQDTMRTLEAESESNKFTLILAISYGSRDEITRAATKFAQQYQSGARNFEEYLYTAGIPDPDLLIRTSGEMRISNFLLWQIAYTELYFTEVLWPDFTKSDLLLALSAYAARQRRYGKRT